MAPSSNGLGDWPLTPAMSGSSPTGVTIGRESRIYLPQVYSTEAMPFVFFILLSAGYHIKLPTPHIAEVEQW